MNMAQDTVFASNITTCLHLKNNRAVIKTQKNYITKSSSKTTRYGNLPASEKWKKIYDLTVKDCNYCSWYKVLTLEGGRGEWSPWYSTKALPSTSLRAKYSTQNGPWERLGSDGASPYRLVLKATCHSAISLMLSSTVNSRELRALYHQRPFFHKNAPFNVTSILFRPKFFGVGHILHLIAIFRLSTMALTMTVFCLIS